MILPGLFLTMTPVIDQSTQILQITTTSIRPNPFSTGIYGSPDQETGGLIDGIRQHGILVPLVVRPLPDGDDWELISGHRRLACARALGFATVPGIVQIFATEEDQRHAVLEYNRQRPKTYSQQMREADALSELLVPQALDRRRANLPNLAESPDSAECRNSASREGKGRTDTVIARTIGMGGKDIYRQARAIWQLAATGDSRAASGVRQIDAGTKTIHAAYKDLRRRDRFTTGFRPTPYDVWAFKHDRAFGIPHPGSIPPSIIAHTLHYFTQPNALVVDPMAGGGTTVDVCESMGRRCMAYDLNPTRSEVHCHDISLGFPDEANGCDLIFCDPPYHTMLARAYAPNSVATAPLTAWSHFLKRFAAQSFATLRPGGFLAFLVANQTEKDLPAGFGYLDHGFLAYGAVMEAGFLPERRISCPMDGAYLPQHVRQARVDGRMLGQVRDLIVARKPRTPS